MTTGPRESPNAEALREVGADVGTVMEDEEMVVNGVTARVAELCWGPARLRGVRRVVGVSGSRLTGD
jgi:hypothetical protein